MEIKYPTYIIAELTGETEQFVMQCRTKFNPERLSWPVDITLAGSSGIGVIKAGQPLEKVIAELRPLLENNSLTTVPVDSLEYFPNTGIFYLKPRQAELVVSYTMKLFKAVLFSKSQTFPSLHIVLSAAVRKLIKRLKHISVVWISQTRLKSTVSVFINFTTAQPLDYINLKK